MMTGQTYIGIACNERNEWVAVLWTGGKVLLSRPFKNTSAEVTAFVRFISRHCARPKVCMKPQAPAALKLIKLIGDIPDVEVVLLSDAGLRLQQTWLGDSEPSAQLRENEAYLLARCAEHMI